MSMDATSPAPIPSSIRVGHLAYTVHVGRDGLPEDAFTGESLDHFGATSEKAQIIYISAQLAPAAARATLMHELMHAAHESTGQTFEPAESLEGDAIGEYAIRVLASPLLCVLRDNPDLVAYLTDAP